MPQGNKVHRVRRPGRKGEHTIHLGNQSQREQNEQTDQKGTDLVGHQRGHEQTHRDPGRPQQQHADVLSQDLSPIEIPELAEHERTALLRRVFDEQYELTEQGPRQRKHEDSGTVKNPHDPDVQWSTKDPTHKTGWEGYKVQIAETVPDGDASQRSKGEPTTGFITEITTTEAIASDFAGREVVEQRQEEHGLGAADECYVDAGYVSDDTLAQADQEGRALMGPARPSRNSSGKLFTAEAFDVSITAVSDVGRPSDSVITRIGAM